MEVNIPSECYRHITVIIIENVFKNNKELVEIKLVPAGSQCAV